MRPGINAQPEYFDIVELGVYLGIVKQLPDDPDPARTQMNQLQKVYRLVNRPGFPVIRMGSRLYFEKAAVATYMRSGVHQSCRTHQSTLSPAILRSLSQE
jgi:hypothetical protein